MAEAETASAWRNPTVVFFHMAFRCAAVLAYVFCTLFSSSFTLNFISCVLLLAFDFWTVKNVSGRLLVGLRWWNEVSEDGTSKWRFESHESFAPHPREARLFWWTLYLFTGLWVLLLIFAVIRFQFSYALIAAVGISLNVSNVVGYTRCQKDAAARLQALAGAYLGQTLVAGLAS